MNNDNIVPLVVGILGAGGLGAFFREIVSGVLKVGGGVSARESKRKLDIVQQRDIALAREAKAWRLVDEEAAKRRLLQDYAAHLRVALIEQGVEPEPEPTISKTITREQLVRLQNEE